MYLFQGNHDDSPMNEGSSHLQMGRYYHLITDAEKTVNQASLNKTISYQSKGKWQHYSNEIEKQFYLNILQDEGADYNGTKCAVTAISPDFQSLSIIPISCSARYHTKVMCSKKRKNLLAKNYNNSGYILEKYMGSHILKLSKEVCPAGYSLYIRGQ